MSDVKSSNPASGKINYNSFAVLSFKFQQTF